jgi:hypothetical protein
MNTGGLLVHRAGTRAVLPRMPAKETDQPYKESNNLAIVIFDMRHVAGYCPG